MWSFQLIRASHTTVSNTMPPSSGTVSADREYVASPKRCLASARFNCHRAWLTRVLTDYLQFDEFTARQTAREVMTADEPEVVMGTSTLNPFRETIVSDPWRAAAADVPEIQAEVFDECLRGIEHVRRAGGSVAPM